MSFTIRTMMDADLKAVETIQSEAYAGHFLESADDYTDAADELEDVMSHHYDFGL